MFAAGVEELLFRAVLLVGLLETFDEVSAMAIGAMLFAGAHYIRRVKRYWTFAGHVVLGVLLCAAFVWTKALWLPFGLHAGGVLVLAGVRPLVRYRAGLAGGGEHLPLRGWWALRRCCC